MGALTVTSVSTFTSCKDYDSDISNLQGQIDKAALSSTVEELKSQVEANKTSADAAATSAEDAMKKAIAANDAVNGVVSSIGDIQGDLDELADAINTNADAAATLIDSLAKAGKTQDGKIADIETEIAKLQTANQAAAESAASALAKNKQLSEELETAIKQWGQSKDGYYTAKAIDNKLDSLADAIQQASDDSIDSLKTVVNGYKAGIETLYTAVTGVEVMTADSTFSTDLTFLTGTIAEDYTFGKAEKDNAGKEYSADPQKEYKKDAIINFPSQILVRVNPVNAKITKDMIKFIDSKGNDLNDLIEVTGVEAYDKLLTTTRATSATGLWVVSLQLKDGVKAADVEKKDGNNHILYAVAINNTAAQKETVADAATRYVASDWDLTVQAPATYQGYGSLLDVRVKAESDDTWTWLRNAKRNTRSGEEITTEGTGLVYAQNGEKILIDFSVERGLKKVDRYYVVLDESNAEVASNASEYNAWKSYDIKNTNKVFTVENGTKQGEFSVTIPASQKTGDEVQFRIFAVNYDGTLVEPNGRAFRVYVGAESKQVSVTANLTAVKADSMATGWVKLDGTLADGGDLLRSNGHVTMTTTDGKIIDVHYDLSKDGETVATDDIKYSECKYIRFYVNNKDQAVEWGDLFSTDHLTAGQTLQLWADDTEAEGILHDDVTRPIVNNITVKLTKQMPTVASTIADLKKWVWKDNQKKNGVYTAYVYNSTDNVWNPISYETVQGNAYKNMDQAINNLTAGWEIAVENALRVPGDDDKLYYTGVLKTYVEGTKYILNPSVYADANDNLLIDNKTQHKSYIQYNYGKISSKDVENDYIVKVEEYSTIFACPLHEDANTVAWKSSSRANATYNTATIINCSEITVTNAFDNKTFGGDLTSLLEKASYAHGARVVTVTITSKESKMSDYFTAEYADGKITLTPVSAATVPTDDVESTMTIKMSDIFGHTHTYTLPFTVKQPQ